MPKSEVPCKRCGKIRIYCVRDGYCVPANCNLCAQMLRRGQKLAEPRKCKTCHREFYPSIANPSVHRFCSNKCWQRKPKEVACESCGRMRTLKYRGKSKLCRTCGQSVMVEAFGDKLTSSQWSKKTGIPSKIIMARLQDGWSAEDAISRPMRTREYPLGAEIVKNYAGRKEMFVKTKDGWIRKSVMVLTKNGSDVVGNASWKVIFRDGNTLNCDSDNLIYFRRCQKRIVVCKQCNSSRVISREEKSGLCVVCLRQKGEWRRQIRNLKGKVFGYWTVIRYVGKSRWECRCVCGKIKDVDGNSLVVGDSRSCRCKQWETRKAQHKENV